MTLISNCIFISAVAILTYFFVVNHYTFVKLIIMIMCKVGPLRSVKLDLLAEYVKAVLLIDVDADVSFV